MSAADLVEVEGMPPKPQAGCTLTAQDGMVVKTARTSEMARVAQNATLEFILVNHPLDCPVGALLPTQPRFEIRPWEFQAVPSVCGLCPVGCNIDVDQREGKVKRILSRNHPEVDEGWLCDKGRFGFSHLYAEDRITEPLRRVRRRGLEEISWDDAVDDAERLLREADGRVAVALSGSETTEQASALAKLVRVGLGAHTAMLPEQIGDLGDDPVVERAPIVDLWLRKARRAGAEIVEIGPAGDVQVAPGTTARACRNLKRGELGDRLRASERAIVIWSGGGAGGGSHLAALAANLGFADRPGSGAFFLPETANGRGVAEAWAAASDEEGPEPEPLGLLIVSGDEAAANPNVRALAERAERVLAITMFHSLAAGWADLVLPGTSYLERDGTYANLEGRIQRLRRAAIPPAPDELAWIAQLAARFELELSPYPSLVFAELSERVFGGVTYEDLGEEARLPDRVPLEAATTEPPDEPVPPKATGGTLQ